jgi:hypothetical protein
MTEKSKMEDLEKHFEEEKKIAERLCKKWALEADANSPGVAALASIDLAVDRIKKRVALAPEDQQKPLMDALLMVHYATVFVAVTGDSTPELMVNSLFGQLPTPDRIYILLKIIAATLVANGKGPQHIVDGVKVAQESLATLVNVMSKIPHED